MVFQSPSLDRKLTVLENLRHQGHLYNLRGHELQSRIDEMLSRFGMADRKADLVETLSGGQRRRVELAKGLLHKPQVLLLDEPSTGLDPRVRRELSDYLEQLRDKDGMTILLTTHLMEEADRCDRLAIVGTRGRLVALDTPRQLKEKIGGDVISVEDRTAAVPGGADCQTVRGRGARIGWQCARGAGQWTQIHSSGPGRRRSRGKSMLSAFTNRRWKTCSFA